jgi:hypothetical protein
MIILKVDALTFEVKHSKQPNHSMKGVKNAVKPGTRNARGHLILNTLVRFEIKILSLLRDSNCKSQTPATVGYHDVSAYSEAYHFI